MDSLKPITRTENFLAAAAGDPAEELTPETREEYFLSRLKPPGGGGGDNAFWRPSVDSNGNISWEKSESSTPPSTQNIMGPQGPQGPPGAGEEDIVDGQWTIKKYADGSYEAWYAYWDLEYTIDVQEGAIFRSEDIILSFPSSLNPQNKKNSVHFGGAMVRNPNFDCWGAYNGQSHMACMFKIYSSQARAANNRYIVNIYVKGKIG